MYPVYESLAAEAGNRCTFIKIDINQAYEIAARYQIRAAPTFFTFLQGEKQDEWLGANERTLRSNVHLLLQMSKPSHLHSSLNLRALLSSADPVLFAKMPPLDKLVAKLGSPANAEPSVSSIKDFISSRAVAKPPQESPVPDLSRFRSFLSAAPSTISSDGLFAAYDLLRAALLDPRVSTFFIVPPASETSVRLLKHVNTLGSNSPYNLRLVSLQMACNLFAATASARGHNLENTELASQLVQLIQDSLMETERTTVRAAAASLCFNIAAVNYRIRENEEREALQETTQVEMAAAILEAVKKEEENKDVVAGLVRALGLLVYMAPIDGELLDFCQALGAREIVAAKEEFPGLDQPDKDALKELSEELLAKGLAFG